MDYQLHTPVPQRDERLVAVATNLNRSSDEPFLSPAQPGHVVFTGEGLDVQRVVHYAHAHNGAAHTSSARQFRLLSTAGLSGHGISKQIHG